MRRYEFLITCNVNLFLHLSCNSEADNCLTGTLDGGLGSNGGIVEAVLDEEGCEVE